MVLNPPNYHTTVALLAIVVLVHVGRAQQTVTEVDPPKPEAAFSESKKAAEAEEYRLLQGDAFLVDTAYLGDDSEFIHKISLRRTNGGSWSAVFDEEVALVERKQQLVFSIPVNLIGSGTERARGTGDAQIEYSYGLYGDSSSRVTVSPGAGLSVPMGSSRKGLGSGALDCPSKLRSALC